MALLSTDCHSLVLCHMISMAHIGATSSVQILHERGRAESQG